MSLSDEVRSLSLVLTQITREARDVHSFVFEPSSGEPVPSWAPGAHIAIEVPGVGTRQYSLSGRTADLRYRITVLREQSGRGGSDFMHQKLRVGDEVIVRAPRNNFQVEEAAGYTLVAGGIGITPFVPMLEMLSARNADWELHYFGRSRQTMAFRDELAELGGAVRILARDEGHEATIDAIVRAMPPGHLLYVCGPTRMIDAVTEAAAAAGVEDRVRFELFVAPPDSGPTADRAGDGSFRVRFEASDLDVEVPPGRSILQIAADHGIGVLHDCEEGICGSCETRVISGEVDHRDHVLTRQEREQNDCMMVCVSRSACPLLVLDL